MKVKICPQCGQAFSITAAGLELLYTGDVSCTAQVHGDFGLGWSTSMKTSICCPTNRGA